MTGAWTRRSLVLLTVLIIISIWPANLREAYDESTGLKIFSPKMIVFLLIRLFTVLRWIDVIFAVLLLLGMFYETAIFLFCWIVYAALMGFLKMVAGFYRSCMGICQNEKTIGFFFLACTLLLVAWNVITLLITINCYLLLDSNPKIHSK